jgi:predicted PurR-regulated permease PerM
VSPARDPLARQRERVTVVFFYALVLLLAYLLFRIVAPFLPSIGWATVLSIVVYPWHERLIRRHGPTRAAAVSTALVAILIIGPGLVVLTAFVQESRAALSGFDRDAVPGQLALLERGWERVRVFIPGAASLEFGTLVSDTFSAVARVVATRVGGFLADFLVFMFQLIVTLIALFFLLRDADTIMREIRTVLPFDVSVRERMIRQTRDLIYASAAASFVIASLQGLAGGLAFALVGLGAPVFWGVAMGLLALLPFLGTWVVWGPAAIWLIASGHVARGVTLAVLGVAIIASIDNFLRPAILSGRAQMNGFLMFISLLGGVGVFGLLGLILGPLVMVIVMSLFTAYAETRREAPTLNQHADQ